MDGGGGVAALLVTRVARGPLASSYTFEKDIHPTLASSGCPVYICFKNNCPEIVKTSSEIQSECLNDEPSGLGSILKSLRCASPMATSALRIGISKLERSSTETDTCFSE